MRIKRIFPLFLAALALSGMIIPFASAQNSNFDVLHIAFIGASSGSRAADDRQLYQAAVLAAEQINAGDNDDTRGLRTSDGSRYNLEVTYYEANTADEAVDLLDDLEDDEVIAILGPQDVKTAQDLVDDSRGIPVLLGTSNALTGDSLFHLSASDEDRVRTAANYLVSERHFSRIGLVSINTTEAQAGIETFKVSSGEDVISEDLVHEADQTDFTDEARRIRESDVEALFVWTLDAQMMGLLEALQDTRWDGTIVYAGLDAEFVAQSGSLVQGLVGVLPWSTAAYDDASQIFVQDYSQRWNSLPSDTAAAYYDAVYLLEAALSESDATPSDVNIALEQLNDIQGVQGVYDAGQTHEVRVVEYAEPAFAEVVRYSDDACVNCPDTWWADSSSETATTQDTFLIGLITTLDGSAEARGQQMEQAARLAIREINDAGGIVGSDGVRYTLDLLTYSAANADDAAAAFDQAIEDGAQIILGPDYNAQVMPNLYRAENASTVQLVSATLNQITLNESADYIFQMRTSDATLAETAAQYLIDGRDVTRFATVASRTEYGLEGIAAFQDRVTAADDAEVVIELEHDVEQTDFADMARDLVASDVEVIAVWSSQPAAGALLKELTALGWNGIFAYGYLSPEFAMGMPETNDIEVVGPVNWFASAQDWVSRDFVARYEDRYGEAPISQAAAYYDAVHLIGRGLNDVGSGNLQTWLSGVEEFVGVQGIYSPSAYATGELSRSVQIIQMNKDQVTQLASYDEGVCRIGCGD